MESSIRKSETQLVGIILALVGGFFDAYTFVTRGEVLANAQSVNMVFFGMNVASGDIKSAFAYFVPVISYAAGVMVTLFIKNKFEKKAIHWRQVVVIFEILIVTIVSFIPESFNMAANLMISFICAMQVQSFRKIKGHPFATTMCTGNLRSGTESFYNFLKTKDESDRRKTENYFLVILTFILGAILGMVASYGLQKKAILICSILLFIVYIILKDER